jgi:tetratricopeptide (TPR) repeat protein
MLFDLRGRRKRVIQVIYVLLAIIMAASLLVIGLPGGINPFNSGNPVVSQDLADQSIERAEDIEQRLATNPNNKNAQAELIRARVAAGNSLVELGEGGQTIVGADAKTQYDLAAEAWDRYLKMTDGKPDPTVAQLISGTLFSLAQGSTVAQFQTNITDAAEAQRLVAESAEAQFKKGEGPPPTGSLVTLATYLYYAQDVEAADAARKKALASTKDDAEIEQIQSQLEAAKREGERIGKIIQQAKKQAENTGSQALDDPLGSLGTQDSTGGAPPQP